MHPWGARTRVNGREPEVTGRRFHAQVGGSRVVERNGPTVQLPPRARGGQAPVLRIRGFVHFHLLGAVARRSLAVLGCRRCCGVTTPSVGADARLGHLSRGGAHGRSICGNLLGGGLQALCTLGGCAPSRTRGSSKSCFAGGVLAKACRRTAGRSKYFWQDAIGVWVPEVPIRTVGAHPECSRKEH